MMMWVRSAVAGTGARGVRGSGTMTTPDPESPGVLGPYHRNAVPLANRPAAARQVPPVPTTAPCPQYPTTAGEQLGVSTVSRPTELLAAGPLGSAPVYAPVRRPKT